MVFKMPQDVGLDQSPAQVHHPSQKPHRNLNQLHHAVANTPATEKTKSTKYRARKQKLEWEAG